MKSVYVVVPISKHLAGQHDQSTHGNWAESMRIVPSTKDVQIPAKWNVNEYKQFINDKELQNNLQLNYIMNSWRSAYSTSRAISQIIAGEKPAPAFDNETTRQNAKILKQELDASPAFGIPSYRTARLTSDVGSSANVGDVLSFNASSVAFDPSDAVSFMNDELTPLFRNQGQQKFVFEFPSDAKGLVYDDSVTHMKDTFAIRPVEGIVRGKFKVSKIIEQSIYDLSLRKEVTVKVHVLTSVGAVQKHLAGKHDQSSHENWAGHTEHGKNFEIKKRLPAPELIAEFQSLSTGGDSGRGQGVPELALAYDFYGMHGKPTVSDSEFQKLKNSGATIIYRGVSRVSLNGVSPQELTNEFRYSDRHWAGFGYDGNGTYTSTDSKTAKEYGLSWDGTREGGAVMEMAIKPEAKFVSKDNLTEMVEKDVLGNSAFSNMEQLWLSDPSNAAMHFGYDGIKVSKVKVSNGTAEDYYIVLNRSALVMPTGDLVWSK